MATCHHATPWLLFFFDNALTCGDYQEDLNPRPESCGPRAWPLVHPPGLCLINVFGCTTFIDISLQNSPCKVYASKIILSKYQVRLASTSVLWIIIFSYEAKKKIYGAEIHENILAWWMCLLQSHFTRIQENLKHLRNNLRMLCKQWLWTWGKMFLTFPNMILVSVAAGYLINFFQNILSQFSIFFTHFLRN